MERRALNFALIDEATQEARSFRGLLVENFDYLPIIANRRAVDTIEREYGHEIAERVKKRLED